MVGLGDGDAAVEYLHVVCAVKDGFGVDLNVLESVVLDVD